MEMNILEALKQNDMNKSKEQLVNDLADMRTLISRLKEREWSIAGECRP